MSENIPGNGRVPDGGSSTVRQSETQPDNTLTYMDRFMAERRARRRRASWRLRKRWLQPSHRDRRQESRSLRVTLPRPPRLRMT